MELNYLRYFYEVAKSGSFTEAARRLRISQSALSKSVALLEEREGVKLLSRSKRGVALTAIGSEVFLQSERLFAIATEIEATCKGMVEKCEGPLNFGASDHVGNYLMVPLLQKFVASYPAVVPRVVTGTPNDLVSAILSNQIECGLYFTQVNVPGIVYEPIAKMKMAVVYSPKLLADKGGHAKLNQMLDRSGLISSIKDQYQKHPSSALMRLFPTPPHSALETSSQEMQKRFCLAGGGIAYLARFMVEAELQDGSLAEIELKKPITIELYLATRRGRELSLTAQTFLALLKSTRISE